MNPVIRRPSTLIVSLLIGLFALVGCRMEMRTQPRLEAYEESTFFANGSALRQPVADTVARSQLHEDEFLQTGRVDGQIAASFPFTPTLATIERGQERFDIFCTPCHGIAGDGKGIITQYGMREPRSFHDPDLRAEAPGYYFNIITNGTRVMPSYAARIPPEDRWAIIAYIRALQLSQNADVNTLTPEDLSAIEGAE